MNKESKKILKLNIAIYKYIIKEFEKGMFDIAINENVEINQKLIKDLFEKGYNHYWNLSFDEEYNGLYIVRIRNIKE